MGWITNLWQKFRIPIGRKKSLGNQGEDLACQFMKSNGFQILDRNYRRSGGEIDIIATKENLIVFVEVKTLRDSKRRPQDAVGKRKQQKIIKTARLYLCQKSLTNQKHRFDIIAIHIDDENGSEIKHFPNAFWP